MTLSLARWVKKLKLTSGRNCLTCNCNGANWPSGANLGATCWRKGPVLSKEHVGTAIEHQFMSGSPALFGGRNPNRTRPSGRNDRRRTVNGQLRAAAHRTALTTP